MRHIFLFLTLAFLSGATLAHDQCGALRKNGLRLLPNSTFEVAYPGPLKGCFTGYLPADVTLEEGLYHFGVFHNGKLAVSFPTIEAGMDLSSNPYQHLKILALSFSDLNGDNQRDVVVIGQNLIANGERVFVQVYWGCGERFVYDDKTNLAIEEYITNKPSVSIKMVQQYAHKKKLSAACALTKP